MKNKKRIEKKQPLFWKRKKQRNVNKKKEEIKKQKQGSKVLLEQIIGLANYHSIKINKQTAIKHSQQSCNLFFF